jgi:hypothetical protein
MGERRLEQRRQVVGPAERDQVVEQLRQMIRWRGHEVGPAGRVVVATDPVLHLAYPPRGRAFGRPLHQGGVHPEQMARFERAIHGGLLHRELHRVDVREHLRAVGSHRAARVATRLRSRETAYRDLKALDLRRRDRLGSQQQPRERLEGRFGARVERGDHPFRLGEDGERLAAEHQVIG